jgi:chromosome segregation ATPase
MYTTLSHQNEIEQKYHEELEHKPSTITANTYRNNFLSSNINNNVYGNTGRSTSMFKVDNSSSKVDKSEIRFIVKREIESYIRMLRSEFTEAINEIRREMYTSNQVQNELANFDSTLTVQQNKIDRYTEEINNNASRLDILDKEFLKTNTELNAKIKNVNSDLTQMKIKFNKIIRNKAFFKSAAKTTFNDVNVDDNDNHQYEIEYNDNEPDYDALYTKKLKDNEDKLKQTVKELETQIQINSAQRVDSINKELIELRNEIHTVKNEYTFNTNNKLNQYYTKQEVDTLMDNTHRNNVNHVTSSITALNEKINKIDVTQLQYQIRNEDLTKQASLQLDEITKLKNAISTLTQSVQEQATQITQLSTRLDSSNEHNKSLLNTFNTINNNSININNALHSLSQLTQNIKQHEVSIQNIQREFNTIKTTLTASNANNAVSSEFIAFKTESNAQLNVIHNKVNELSNIMDKQSKDINTQLYAITNSMNVLDSEYHSAETHLNKQLNDISTELTKQNTQINANATQIAMIYQRVNSVDQRNSYSGNSFIDKGVSYPVVDLNQLYAKVEVLNQKVPMLETQFHTFNQTQQSYNETLTLKVNQLERNKIIPIHNNNIPSAIGNEEYNTITESINILNDKIPALEAKINTMSMTQQTFNNTIKQKVDACERNRNDIVNDVKRVSNDIQVVEQKLQQITQQQQQEQQHHLMLILL